MRPDKKLLLLVLGTAGVWALGMLGLFLVLQSRVSDSLSDTTVNNIGALAAPKVYGVIYIILGVVGAFLVALLLSISLAALNELGFFAPWSRLQVRIWALNAALVTLGAIAVGYRFFPGVRSTISMFFELFR
ncbi:MAG: hypothetical protein WBM26_05345 [Polyangiales bacterium]